MKEGLNLLPSVAKFQAAKIRLRKRINLGMGIFLGCWVLSAVFIFSWFWLSSYSLKKTESKNTTALNNYGSLATNVVLSKKNKYQAKLVGQVLKERFEYGSSIEKIMNLFSENITLENFEIKDKKQFLLKGSMVNGINISEVEDKVRDINLGLYPDFGLAKLNSVAIGYNSWTFEMEVDLI
ncbi:MAG: hypothetical protein PHP97_03220 [Candidatus Shapirobacteria bacterium]|nr:hypothetical protein [Candidatus Shapirobacteria bacterium]MDD3002331.1 hypothetical protein [Candidatus Shapirobacteria bacterium]MDD4382664.1 hypothetical protein [Candidatus Shapirobacteria bacterium]